MRHTARIALVNLADLNVADAGFIKPEEIRQVIVTDAIVDTGATRLSLPQPLIEHLGLTPVGSTRAKTTNGIVDRIVYSTVQFTLLERKGTMDVTAVPADVPVLIGHIILELLDLCLDIRKGLIYNPAHDNEWIEEAW